MSAEARHKRAWRLLNPIARFLGWLKFNYSSPKYNVEGPFLLLINHVTDWDPIMVGSSFKNQFYFVASEHILRLGFISRVLEYLVAPIGRQKGGSAVSTVRACLKELKHGNNVALFPEGNRSWDGKSRPFPDATGKLAKSSGASLVTFRLSGGYFSSPRWSGSSVRRGRMTGRIVRIYTPEELRSMSAAEIDDAIRCDLYEDAYAVQREQMVEFRGNRRAEHLEKLLFICPKCGSRHTLRSKGNFFYCDSCGMKTEYTQTGFFSGGELPFDNVCDWNAWQDEELLRLCAEDSIQPVFSDDCMDIRSVESGKGSTLLASGVLSLYRDRLELPDGEAVYLGDIAGMAVLQSDTLFFSTAAGMQYQVSSEKVRCTSKYLTACRMLGCNVGVGV